MLNQDRPPTDDNGDSSDNSDDAGLRHRQRQVASQVILQPLELLPRYVVGVDAAYIEQPTTVAAIGAAVVIDSTSFEIVEQATAVLTDVMDYRPGFLAFREAPVLMAAVNKLSHQPELVVCDGHGIAHPARAGLACHVGVGLGVPTIGCAKNHLFGSQGLTGVEEVGPHRGDSQPLLAPGPVGDQPITVGEQPITAGNQPGPVGDQPVAVGAAVRTRSETKCVFVSPGHLIDATSSVAHILALSPRFRLPETTRAADQACRAAVAGF